MSEKRIEVSRICTQPGNSYREQNEIPEQDVTTQSEIQNRDLSESCRNLRKEYISELEEERHEEHNRIRTNKTSAGVFTQVAPHLTNLLVRTFISNGIRLCNTATQR